MFEIKKISKDSIPSAMSRAEHYRLLNEPRQAESICRDILSVDPGHQDAILNLILSLTDQFGINANVSNSETKELCTRLDSEYKQNYYRGLVEERLGRAALRRATPRVKHIAYELYVKAMNYYELAEKCHPEDNEESVLRWNACVRAIQEFKLEPSPNEDHTEQMLDV